MGSSEVGGVLGRAFGNAISMSNISSSAIVAGHNKIGGIVGHASSSYGEIRNAIFTGDMSQPSRYGYYGSSVGGIAGSLSYMTISDVVVNTNITGKQYVGGVAGIMFSNNASISKAYVDANIHAGTMYGGGIAGKAYSSSQVENSHATGSLTGNRLGGVVGQLNSAFIRNSYSTMIVTSNDAQTGGLVGEVTNVAEDGVLRAYWDIEVNGQSSSSAGEGKSTAELQCPTAPGDVSCDPTIFADWDATVWDFGTSTDYPVLR